MTWPDTGPTLSCPACGGPIGFWVIQPSFKCHHCSAHLASNHRHVQWACFYLFLAAWAVATTLFVAFSSRSVGEAALLAAQLLVPVTMALGWLVLKYKVQLVQVPKQRGA